MKLFTFIPKTNLFIALVASSILFASCEREPSSGPNAEGIHGNIEVYNVYGEKQSPADVTVTIEQNGKTTKTESDGTFWLPQLPSGTYTLKYTKSDFTTNYVREIEHIRTKHTSTQAPVVRMIEPSTFFVAQKQVSVLNAADNSPYFSISGSLNKAIPAAKKITLRLYIGKDASVSEANYETYFPYQISGGDFTVNYPYLDNLRYYYGIKSGDRVYMALYTDALEGDACEGTWQKPICSSSTTVNKNAAVLTVTMP